MTQTNVNVQMQIRRDTAANWASSNPVLLAGEWGYITDTGKFKIGNGSTNFTFLPDAVLSTFGGTLTDHLKISNQKELRLSDDTANTANEHYSSLKAGSQSANINYTLPTTAPTDNQYLKCSAAGVLTWDTFTGADFSPDFGSQNIVTTGTLSSGAISTTGNLTVSNTNPKLFFTDTNNDSDFALVNNGGVFRINDETNSLNRFSIASDGTTTVQQNLDVGAGTLHVDSSNNRIGINTTTPDRLIHGYGATPILKLDSTNNEAYIQLVTASPSNETYIGLINGNIYFSITGTGVTSTVQEKFRVEKTGDVFLPDGNVNLVSGHGVHFHNYGTGTNISSNLLDDYEQGTFDPTDNFTTMSFQGAHYIKIAKMVYFWISYYVSAGNGAFSSGQKIFNLPFNNPQTDGSVFETVTASIYHNDNTMSTAFNYLNQSEEIIFQVAKSNVSFLWIQGAYTTDS